MSVESPKISGLVTVRYVVMSVLNRLQDYSMKSYLRLLQLAVEGFSEEFALFHTDVGKEIVYLHMSLAKTCDLPGDFVDWLVLGYPVNGKLRAITPHDRILLPRTYYNTLIQTAAQFVTDHAAAYLVGGVVVTSSGANIILTSSVAGVDFAGSTTVTNTSGDLAGTAVTTTPNAPAVKRVDTITLSGTYGAANILCDAVTREASFDTGDVVGNADSDESEGVSNAIFFSDHFRNGQFTGGLYGLSGGIDRAYFRFDLESTPRRIVFSGSTPRSEIVLEYISSGMKSDGTTLIPREIVAPLRNYILWHKDENNPRVAYNEKERLKREYTESIEALRFFENSFTKDEYMRMLYSTYRQSAKR